MFLFEGKEMEPRRLVEVSLESQAAFRETIERELTRKSGDGGRE